MNFYEIIFLIRNEISILDIEKIVSYYKEIVIKLKGTVIFNEYWGIHPIFHDIKGSKKVHFLLFKVQCTAAMLSKIRENYKYNENIVRGFEIRINDYSNTPSFMARNLNNNNE